jgi:uncharacterized protein (DUF1697 family)
MPRFVALLRGINVGGKNLVPMAALRSWLEAAGFEAVATYIQSGNVLFETPKPKRGLAATVEAEIEARLGRRLVVVVRSHAELAAIVAGAPPGFGGDRGRYLDDVVFLREPVRPAAALREVSPRAGVDEVAAGPGVLYFRRLAARSAESRLNRVASLPVYGSMTIRNWNTTTKLLALLDARAAGGGPTP